MVDLSDTDTGLSPSEPKVISEKALPAEVDGVEEAQRSRWIPRGSWRTVDAVTNELAELECRLSSSGGSQWIVDASLSAGYHTFPTAIQDYRTVARQLTADVTLI